MPPPDRMLATIRQAAMLCRGTPGRVGHLVQLQDCTELLVVGDLHGHVPNFQAVLAAADLAAHPGRHLVLQEVIHGAFRYPGGGDKSHQLLDLFAVLKGHFPHRVHLLPGNHELAQWSGRSIGKGDDSQNGAFIAGVVEAYKEAAPDVNAAYLELLKSLPLAIRTPNAVFVSHSLPPARLMGAFSAARLREYQYSVEDLSPGGFVYGLLWGRDTSAENVTTFLRKVDADWLVTGHIPTEGGFSVPNHKQVVVDCSDTPAAYILFPTDRPLTHPELVACVTVF